MIRYPLPPQITHDGFHGLVTDIYFALTKNGIDPALNMIIADRDEALDDGTTLTHFSIIITKTAAAILDQPTT